MTTVALPPQWVDITVSVLVLCGAAIAFTGSLGLLRLKSYFERVHAPSIIATMGCWCIMHATVLYFTATDDGLGIHALLIALFVAITVPVTNIFLMRAALFRARRMGEKVPPSLSRGTSGTEIDSCPPKAKARHGTPGTPPCSTPLPSA